MENAEFQETVGSWHRAFHTPTLLIPFCAATAGMGERVLVPGPYGTVISSMLWVWMEPGRHKAHMCIVLWTSPCSPAGRELPGMAWTGMSNQVLVQAVRRAAVTSLPRPHA